MSKIRVDLALVERGLVESRERAQILVMAGQVFADGQKVVKPASLVKAEAALEVRGAEHPYVSRGGLKLEAALDEFAIEVRGFRCLDLGASTGGFTDLLLQRGASAVTAVDVGRGQLHWKLRNDPRVTVLEKTNARYLELAQFSEPFDLATGDLSFIGLNLILPVAFSLLKPAGQAIFLIKPQFEAGRAQVGRKGVVRKAEVHREVLHRVLSSNYGSAYLRPVGLCPSPIKGPAGNIEYLVYYAPGAERARFDAERAVERAIERVRVELE